MQTRMYNAIQSGNAQQILQFLLVRWRSIYCARKSAGEGHNQMEVPESMAISPFPEGYRASGVLLHVTSLPSPYGIGDFGPAARRWIDWLAAAGQSWWQLLPLGPTGYGNCPYQLLSTFGGNPLLISPEMLVADGLLHSEEIPGNADSAGWINYEAVTHSKAQALGKAWERFRAGAVMGLTTAFEHFCDEQRSWLDDFALFECLRQEYQTGSFWQWPREIAEREPKALTTARTQFAEAFERTRFEQFLVNRQLADLKAYAHGKGLKLIGDLPFFASPESSDVWANPELFLLDEQLRLRFVAGVPPDYFSPDGQLWGNPVYDWDALRSTGYDWWLRRIRGLLKHVDVIRLDHFRAFAAAWHVPIGAQSALAGEWCPGPGANFFRFMRAELGELPFLAEDLGEITPDVRALRDKFNLTGMRVLQFAFDGDPDNPFLPANYDHNTVAYTATHDNDTTRGWYDALDTSERQVVWKSLQRSPLSNEEVAPEMIRLIWASRAAVAITPLQDLLNLGSNHRMNTPGRSEGNWQWQCAPEMLSVPHVVWLRSLTEQTGRMPAAGQTS